MLRRLRPQPLLSLAVSAFALGFGALSMLRHASFETGRFDLGNMAQAVWSTSHGRPLEATSLGGEQFVRLGAHFDPILALFAPLWWLWPSPNLLLAVQAAATALGALPVFWLARKHLGSERVALGLALAYLLSPALHWQTLSEFHPVALATPFLLFAIWYLDEQRMVPFLVFALLAVATKEHVGLAVAGLGAWYALSRRQWRAGALAAAGGVAVSALALGLVIPHFSPEGASSFYGRYAHVGGSAGGVARTLLEEPATVARALTEQRDAAFLLQLLLPVLGACLAAPLLLAAALPELLLNLLSATRTQTSIHFHYSAATLPFVYAGAVLGVARLARGRPRVAERAAGALVAVSLAAGYALGPLPVWAAFPGAERLATGTFDVSAHDRAALRATELVPDSAVVSTSNSLGGHLSERRRILSFPYLHDAEWVAVDETEPGYSDRIAPLPHAAAIARLRRDDAWRLVFSEDGVLVFRRR